MAFFKSRSHSSVTAEDRSPESEDNQSLDVLRQRARHRLIGATVLVLIGVIGFPMVFDTKPREVAADIRIDMPDRETVKPSQAPAAPAVEKLPVPDNLQVPDSQVLPAPPKADNKGAEPKSVQALVPDTHSANTKPAETKKPDDKTLAQEEVLSTTTLSNQESSKSSGDASPRFVVQVGAYSDEAKVKEVRTKLEKAGFKTYVHVAQVKEGKRTRVRIGPFDSKEEAQKTVKKIKALNLTAAVLTL
ncbi:MAG: SPOR domain-containing protein [Betaproteobacteria bacterium]|nr:SPOR domain-containing protein [Betaproteobacteria bacterium]